MLVRLIGQADGRYEGGRVIAEAIDKTTDQAYTAIEEISPKGQQRNAQIIAADLLEIAVKSRIDLEGRKTLAADAVVCAGLQKEGMQLAGQSGNGWGVDMFQAVTSAEVTLQTVIAVRDRMIAAYQEIMRMPI